MKTVLHVKLVQHVLVCVERVGSWLAGSRYICNGPVLGDVEAVYESSEAEKKVAHEESPSCMNLLTRFVCVEPSWFEVEVLIHNGIIPLRNWFIFAAEPFDVAWKTNDGKVSKNYSESPQE